MCLEPSLHQEKWISDRSSGISPLMCVLFQAVMNRTAQERRKEGNGTGRCPQVGGGLDKIVLKKTVFLTAEFWGIGTGFLMFQTSAKREGKCSCVSLL